MWLSWSGQEIVFRPGPGADATVNDLQMFIENKTTIPPREQITLFGPPFRNADRRSTLSVLRGKKVFVYDRTSFSFSRGQKEEGDTIAEEVVLSPQHLNFPTRESLPSCHRDLRELAEADDPLLRALAEFERKFYMHLNVAEVLHSGSQSRLTSCERCLTEQSRVLDALNAAQQNLFENNEALSRSFGRLWSQVRASHRQTTATLDNFEHHLNRTADIHLDEALQQAGKHTLYDWLPVERLRQWAQRCAHYENLIWKKASDLSTMFGETEAAVRKEMRKKSPLSASLASVQSSTQSSTSSPSASNSSSASLRASVSSSGSGSDSVGGDPVLRLFGGPNVIEAEIAAAKERCNRQQAIAEEIGEHYRDVLDKVTAAQEVYLHRQHASGDAGASVDVDPMEMCRNFDQLRQQHEKTLLAEARRNDAFLLDFMQRCAAAKTLAVRYLFRRLRSVAALQTRIRDQGQRMTVVKEAVAGQKKAIADLEHVEKMPAAYMASLLEIVKRREYKRAFVAEAEHMMETIARMQEAEKERRKVFLETHGQHLPRNFLPILAELPPLCELQVPRFDHLLPPVSVPLTLSNSSTSSGSGDSRVAAVDFGRQPTEAAAGMEGTSGIPATTSAGDVQLSTVSTQSSRELQSTDSRSSSSSTSTTDGSSSKVDVSSRRENPRGDGLLLLQSDTGFSPGNQLASTRASSRQQEYAEANQILEARCQAAEAEVKMLKAQLESLKQQQLSAHGHAATGVSTLSETENASTGNLVKVDVGPLQAGAVAIFLPVILFRRTRCLAFIAAQRGAGARFLRRRGASAAPAMWNTSTSSSGADSSGGESDSGSDAGDGRKPSSGRAPIPHFLSESGLRQAVRLLSGPNLQSVGVTTSGNTLLGGAWPKHWPVQVIARVITAEPCVATAGENPYDLPLNAPYFRVEAEILDCQPFFGERPRSAGSDDGGGGGVRSSSPGVLGREAGSGGRGAMLPPLSAHRFQRVASPAAVFPVTPGTPGTIQSVDSLALSEDEDDESPGQGMRMHAIVKEEPEEDVEDDEDSAEFSASADGVVGRESSEETLPKPSTVPDATAGTATAGNVNVEATEPDAGATACPSASITPDDGDKGDITTSSAHGSVIQGKSETADAESGHVVD